MAEYICIAIGTNVISIAHAQVIQAYAERYSLDHNLCQKDGKWYICVGVGTTSEHREFLEEYAERFGLETVDSDTSCP